MLDPWNNKEKISVRIEFNCKKQAGNKLIFFFFLINILKCFLWQNLELRENYDVWWYNWIGK